jgi:hypothetical protein
VHPGYVKVFLLDSPFRLPTTNASGLGVISGFWLLMPTLLGTVSVGKNGDKFAISSSRFRVPQSSKLGREGSEQSVRVRCV